MTIIFICCFISSFLSVTSSGCAGGVTLVLFRLGSFFLRSWAVWPICMPAPTALLSRSLFRSEPPALAVLAKAAAEPPLAAFISPVFAASALLSALLLSMATSPLFLSGAAIFFISAIAAGAKSDFWFPEPKNLSCLLPEDIELALPPVMEAAALSLPLGPEGAGAPAEAEAEAEAEAPGEGAPESAGAGAASSSPIRPDWKREEAISSPEVAGLSIIAPLSGEPGAPPSGENSLPSKDRL